MPPKKKSPARKRKKTLVEKVMNERNLVVTPTEAPSTAPVVHSSEFGQVRIEGEVTPQKLALAKQFDSIFQQATGEIMDLAAYIPDERVLNLVKSNNVTAEMVEDMKKAPAWTFFDVGGQKLMKTPDQKLDTVQNYCYRLERAVIDQIRLRKDSENNLNNQIADLLKRLELANGTAKQILEQKEKLQKRVDSQADTIRTLQRKNPTFFLRFVLEVRPLYDRLKTAIIKLLS